MLPSWLADDGATLMGIVNVNADSFSDPRDEVDVAERIAAATAAVRAGASIVDLGAQSAATDLPEIDAAVEAAALVPVVTALRARGVPTSVDTYKAAVARAVLDAGAAVVNDYSGVHDDEILEVTASAGAWYVLTHNPAPPKSKLLDPDRYGPDVTGAVIRDLSEALPRLTAHGLRPDRIVLDPGIDLSKTPAQSLAVLRGLDRLREAFDHPLLVAIGRKDVLGVLTGRPPAGRDPATLAALGVVADLPATLARVHDVAGCRDYLTVHRALHHHLDLDPRASLDVGLRHEGR